MARMRPVPDAPRPATGEWSGHDGVGNRAADMVGSRAASTACLRDPTFLAALPFAFAMLALAART